MAMFKAFKPEAMNKIANAMGYSGDMNQFQQFIEQDPAKQARMNMFKEAAVQMAKGGYAKKYKAGGAVPPRRTEIKGQDHMLAYITPEEGELLKAHGGSGKPGPMGIPSFEGGEADDYANWKGFRLPTEFEHEYFDKVNQKCSSLWSWTSSQYKYLLKY